MSDGYQSIPEPIKTLSALHDWPEPRDSEWVEPVRPEGAIKRLIHRLTGKHPPR